MFYLALKYLHVIGAAVLLGTGAGIAFFMLMAHFTRQPAIIAGVASIVVLADFLFTATAVVAQPITGVLLVWNVGYSLSEGWIALSILLYIFTGVFLASRRVDADANSRHRPRRCFEISAPPLAISPPVLDVVRLRLSSLCGRPRDLLADGRQA